MIFSDTVRPKLSTLGEALGRNEMDQGIKSGQAFFELVASEYNKVVEEYGGNAFPHVVVGRSLPPSHFQEVNWDKCKGSWKAMCNEYDNCFKAW